MTLDDLKETIETLRERIQAHRPYLEGNETRTRQVLIDPMLHELGWNVGDPNCVELEYRIGQGRADYALMGSERLIAVIEAKALGKPLDEKETMQALNYANAAGIPYMTLTNGDHWRMLEVFKQAPIKDRILMEFQLTRDEPYACALQALGLWRPNLTSGEPQEAATPVMIEEPAHAESASTISEPSKGKKVAESSNNGDWMPLTSLEVKAGAKPPKYIKFSDLQPISLKSWTDLLVNAAEHLLEIGKLSAEICPIRTNSLILDFSHNEPVDLEGKRIRFKRKIRNELWLIIDRHRSEFMHKNACLVLKRCGIDPSTVLVSTNPR